jgi:hypothetical protein
MKIGVSSNSTEPETKRKRNYEINNYFAIGLRIINNSQKNAVRDGVVCK